jgi:hypothetical protein
MNQQNFNVLREAIKKIGLPSFVDFTIEPVEFSSEQPLEVQLTDVIYRDDSQMEVTLYFERPIDGNVYSFTRYNCRLRYYEDSAKDRAHTFYRSKVAPTMREVYNLLQGRSVNKDINSIPDGVYNAWLTLNFQEKDSNGNYKLHYFPTNNGYQIENVLDMYPIRELQDEELKAALLLSLKAGDCCLVTLDRARKSEKVYIEAIPRLKTIGIYPIKVSH